MERGQAAGAGAPHPLLPAIIGHRGAAADAPENTLAGFRAAKRLGASWVEFDLRLSADGTPILLHDDSVDRTSDGTGLAEDLPLAVLRGLDAGSWFSADYRGERIPVLSEAIGVLAECGLGANLELKPAAGAEAATARAVAIELRRDWPSSLPTPLISSFAIDALAAFSDAAPEFPRGVLFERLPRDWAETAASLGCASVHCDHRYLDGEMVCAVRGRGYDLLAYTVNEPARARALLDWGVAAIFTDVPGAMAEFLRPRQICH